MSRPSQEMDRNTNQILRSITEIYEVKSRRMGFSTKKGLERILEEASELEDGEFEFDINAVAVNGKNALHMAIDGGHLKSVAHLLEICGANPDVKDRNASFSVVPLQHATNLIGSQIIQNGVYSPQNDPNYESSKKITMMLLKSGAKVDQLLFGVICKTYDYDLEVMHALINDERLENKSNNFNIPNEVFINLDQRSYEDSQRNVSQEEHGKFHQVIELMLEKMENGKTRFDLDDMVHKKSVVSSRPFSRAQSRQQGFVGNSGEAGKQFYERDGMVDPESEGFYSDDEELVISHNNHYAKQFERNRESDEDSFFKKEKAIRQEMRTPESERPGNSVGRPRASALIAKAINFERQ